MDKEILRTLVAAHAKLKIDIADLNDDTNLYDAGLTSLNTVNLMLAIEDQFDLVFDDESLNRGTFQSIDALSKVLAMIVEANFNVDSGIVE